MPVSLSARRRQHAPEQQPRARSQRQARQTPAHAWRLLPRPQVLRHWRLPTRRARLGQVFPHAAVKWVAEFVAWAVEVGVALPVLGLVCGNVLRQMVQVHDDERCDAQPHARVHKAKDEHLGQPHHGTHCALAGRARRRRRGCSVHRHRLRPMRRACDAAHAVGHRRGHVRHNLVAGRHHRAHIHTRHADRRRNRNQLQHQEGRKEGRVAPPDRVAHPWAKVVKRLHAAVGHRVVLGAQRAHYVARHAQLAPLARPERGRVERVGAARRQQQGTPWRLCTTGLARAAAAAGSLAPAWRGHRPARLRL
mmetsp:Transcript_11768/g.34788  ORF Transcript_11768/g.34788 Transcript_11768/m.34788 type:complete len:307 (+) Transcript_11768:558-1478(+)